ncbi:MAG: CPBP family intramembrane metalloprotease [Methanobrevibacter sp.]|jgi:membrane protease YdiL (CAAX protease family)|nr:CPBP family intramembrane metalloprotease [Candidatus Methanovirga basalitermitum]
MISEFLNNVYKGKNGWKGYTITLLLTLFLNSFVAIFYLLFFLGFYMAINTFNPISNAISETVYYFISMFCVTGLAFIFLILSINVFHRRDIFSLINTSKKYNFRGNVNKWYNRIRWNKFFKGIAIWSIFMILSLFVPYFIDPSKFILNFDLNHFIILIGLLFLTIPIQASFEELLFRGYLNQGLSLKIKRPIIIIIISSTIFGLGHIVNGGFDPVAMFLKTFSAFLFGIITSLTTLADDGIEFSSGVHIINNIFAFSMVGDAGADNFGTLLIQTDSLGFYFEFFWDIILLVMFLLILIIYRHDEIKEVLKKRH